MGKVECFNDTNSPSKLIYTTHKTGRYFTYNKRETTGHLSIKHGKDIDHHQGDDPALAFSSLIWRSQKSPSISGRPRTHHPQKTPQSQNCQVYKLFIVWRPPKIWTDNATRNNQKQPNKLISLMLFGYIRIHIFSGHHQTNNPTTAAPFCRRHPARSIRASWQCQ